VKDERTRNKHSSLEGWVAIEVQRFQGGEWMGGGRGSIISGLNPQETGRFIWEDQS
jgi:hypothetical protein